MLTRTRISWASAIANDYVQNNLGFEAAEGV
jgi:hypothetical protein